MALSQAYLMFRFLLEETKKNSIYHTGIGFSTDPNDVFGCTDVTATNFNSEATVDDFSCTLPCSLSLVVDSLYSPYLLWR